MLKRTTILIALCLLLLPSCKYNMKDLFASDPNAPVEFSYAPGTRYLHSKGTATIMQNGKVVGGEITMLTCDYTYVIKNMGGRLAWDITVDNWELMGQPKLDGPVFSISFTSDKLGNDKADLVVHESQTENAENAIKTAMAEIGLSQGSFKPGEPSIPFPAAAFKDGDVVVEFGEAYPKYIYDGIKMIDGEDCYSFSYHAQSVEILQNGQKSDGSMTVNLVTDRNMLTVREEVVLTMEGPLENMTSKLHTLTTRAEPPTGSQHDDLRARLKAAPIMPVSEPMDFRYVPSQGRYQAKVTLQTGKASDNLNRLPFLNYDMAIRTESAKDRLGWDITMESLSVMGVSLDEVSPHLSFTTDEHGEEISDFKETAGPEILTEDDIRKDFVIPSGVYRSGDVVMPVNLGNEVLNNDFIFPEGSGYVFKGMQHVDNLNVVVLEAEIDHFTARNKKTGMESSGYLKITRRYDQVTMLPLWFQGHTEIVTENKGVVITNAEFYRIDD